MKPLKRHFASHAQGKTACGAAYHFGFNHTTNDHLEVSCLRCLKMIEKAGRVGEMIFTEN